jgi:hypothetical protein
MWKGFPSRWSPPIPHALLIAHSLTIRPCPSDFPSPLLKIDQYIRDVMDRFCPYRGNLHVKHFTVTVFDRRDASALWKLLQETKDCLTYLDMWVKTLPLLYPEIPLRPFRSYSDTNMAPLFRIPILFVSSTYVYNSSPRNLTLSYAATTFSGFPIPLFFRCNSRKFRSSSTQWKICPSQASPSSKSLITVQT